MNNTVGNILNFFADSSKTIGSRLGTITISILLLILLDLLSGLTYNFQTNNKLNQLENVHKLMLVHSTDAEKKMSLKEMENYILHKRHYSEVLSGWARSLTQSNEKIKNEPISARRKPSVLSLNLMILSSSFGFFLVLLLILFVPFYSRFKGIKLEGFELENVLALTITLAFMAAITTSLAYLIPVIDEGKPYWNYVVNFLIHTFFIVLVGMYGGKGDSNQKRSMPKILVPPEKK